MKSLFMLGLLATSAAASQVPPPAPQPRVEVRRPAISQGRCLAPEEARALATFVLPGLIDGLAKRCRGTLARDAYLRQPASAVLTDRLRTDAVSSWPAARTAIEKLSGNRLPTLFGERFVRNAAEGVATDVVLRDFTTGDCDTVDGLVANLAPLSSANMSGALAALIALSGDRLGADAPLRICTAESPR